VAAPPSTPPPEKAAQSEGGPGSGTGGVSVAWIAAVAAIVGTLLGAAVTGHYTTAATDSQIAAESKRTTTEFLREQKAVYAAFIADETELTRKESEFESLLFHPEVNSMPALKETDATKGAIGTTVPASNIEQLEQLRNQIPVIFDRVNKGNNSIQLIGSETARAASKNVVNLHFQPLAEILEGGPIVNRPQSGFPELEKLESIPGPNPPASPIDEFLAAARKDLGVG